MSSSCAARHAGRIGSRCRTRSVRRWPPTCPRPHARRRPAVFLTCRAPHGPIRADLVGDVVQRACLQAGLAARGPAPAAARPGRRDAAPGRGLGRDQPGAAPSGPGHHRRLRQGRPRRAAARRAALAGSGPMSALEQALTDYLQLRHSLGHELADAGRLLPRFVAYLDARGLSTVTVEAALAWAQKPRRTGRQRDGRRAAADDRCPRLRPLPGRHRRGTEVPPLGLMPRRQRWRPPFIYTPADIDALMEPGPPHDRLAAAGGDLPDPDRAARRHRPADRGSDQARPQRHRLGPGVLLIRESKFGKSRLVPLHASTMQALTELRRVRDRLQPHPSAELLRVPDPQAADLRRRPADVPAARRQRRDRRRRAVAAAAARLETHLRGPHPARLVSQRRGRPGQAPVAVDLPRVTANRAPPTGTCPPPRNCSRWPPPASDTAWSAARS